MTVEIAVLTKSSKHGGYCVAGINPRTGQWIRLVSGDERTHGALQIRDMQYGNGADCQPLDVARVPAIAESPLAYQPENVLADRRYCWEWTGIISINDILKIHPPERHPFLFGNQKPYITAAEIGRAGHSLVLVKVKSLYISHTTNPQGKRKTKAGFQYQSDWYHNMSVTDPAYYEVPDGTKIEAAALVISLPDVPFQEDRYYKFIAQIYPL